MLSSVLLFLNIGGSEMILIVFVALMLFGGDKLPGIARGLGKGIRDFKDASEGVKREINNQINSYEEKSETSATASSTTEIQPVANTIPAVEEHRDIVEETHNIDSHNPIADAYMHSHTAVNENTVSSDQTTENKVVTLSEDHLDSQKAPSTEPIKTVHE